jgi:HlyD family secretion protein
MKKFLIALLIIVLVGAGGFYAFTRFTRATANPAAIDLASNTVSITRGELLVTISATGQVRPRQTATLNWQTSGTVEKVLAAEGDQIKPGDMLASLAQASLSQNIISAQGDLVSTQQSLADLSTQANTARVQAMQNIVTFEQAVRDAQYKLDNYTIPSNQQRMTAVEAVAKMKQLLDEARQAFEPYRNASSGDQTRQNLKDALDQAQSDYNAAVRRLSLEYDLEVAQANLDKAYSDYDKWKDGPDPNDVKALEAKIAAIQATLDMPHLTAPFAGTVTNADVQVGDQVNAGKAAFRIDDLSALYVDLQVSEIDINQVQVGQPVTVVFDAIQNQQYHGKVSGISLVGNQSSGVVNYTVTVELTDPDEKVRLGMTGEVKIEVADKQNVLLVPNQAIKLENGVQVVYLLVPGQPTPQRIVITLGLSNDQYSEVLSGDLNPGDLVELRAVVNTNIPRFFMGGGAARQAAGDQGNTSGGTPGGQP